MALISTISFHKQALLIFKPIKVQILQFAVQVVYSIVFVGKTISNSLKLALLLPLILDVDVIQVTLMRPIIPHFSDTVKLIIFGV